MEWIYFKALHQLFDRFNDGMEPQLWENCLFERKQKKQQFSTIGAILAQSLLEETGAYSHHIINVLSFFKKSGTICRCQMSPLCYTPQVTQHVGTLLIMTWCKVLRMGEGGFSTSCWEISGRWEVFTDDEGPSQMRLTNN